MLRWEKCGVRQRTCPASGVVVTREAVLHCVVVSGLVGDGVRGRVAFYQVIAWS